MGYAPETETLEICRDLIRIDTTNYGDDSGPGERKAAEYVAASLSEVGIESELVESEPGRTSLVARWGDQDSPALVAEAGTDLERQLSEEIMRGARPSVRRLAAGEVLTRQGEPGDELYLVLDGMLDVEVDGTTLGQVGPGTVLGERALLEDRIRTSTLTAATRVVVAVAPGDTIDLDRLAELARGHHREET